MAFDGVTTFALIDELSNQLIGGRIDKIYQPEKDEIHINIRNKKDKYLLLLSANPNNPRVHLTQKSKVNPPYPPNFCMLLRKILSRGRILSIDQFSMDRIIQMDIETLNELGDVVVRSMIIEIMGRHSNIILINKENNIIIESIKKVGSNISRYRQVLPGREYVSPPDQNKINPLETGNEEISLILDKYPAKKKAERFFMESFTGISPVISREVCFRSHIDSSTPIGNLTAAQKKHFINTFIEMMKQVQNKDFTPTMIYNENETGLIDFAPIDLKQYESLVRKNFESISVLIEQFYDQRDKLERMKQKNSGLLNLLQNKLDRNYKKLGIQREEYRLSQEATIYKLYGELITANIHAIKKGVAQVTLVNFYSEQQEEIEIPLSVNLSSAENAQKYFKKYNKSKNARLQLEKQIKHTQDEIYYLESQLTNIDNIIDDEGMEEIKEELRKEGYLAPISKKNNAKVKPSSPSHFKSSDGYDIYVGKNNRQNDHLTLKDSSDKDLWFHTKDIPGSHVVIKNPTHDPIPEQTLLEAASLAAYYSKAKTSSNVPVDFTEVKHVRKPRGAKPGMVIYDHNRTIFVTPKEESIAAILRVK